MEVSEEVFDVLCQSVREMRNHERRKRYHRAYYSLDAFDWMENYALEHSPSPEQLVMLAEERAEHDRQILRGLHQEHSVVLNAGAAIHAVNMVVTFPALLPVLIEPTFLHDGGNLVRHFHERVLCVERVVVLSQIDNSHTALLFGRGAILEAVFPAVVGMEGEEVKAFLIALSRLPGAAELAEKAPKNEVAE